MDRSTKEIKMDKTSRKVNKIDKSNNFLNPGDKSRTLNYYHNYQTRNLLLSSSSASFHKLNRLQLLTAIITLFILNLHFITATYHGQPQQAPPTSLTIKNNQKYNTTYACEGSSLTINCDQPGSEINVIRSNFGRFSISICNAQGVLDWSVNCFSKNTVELIRRACNGQRQCLLQASTELFGNPCPATYKYLEVHYECTNKETASSLENNSNTNVNNNNKHHLPSLSSSPVDSLMNSNQINQALQARESKRNSAPSIIIPDNPLLKHHSTSKQSQPSIPLVPLFTTPSSISGLFNRQQQPSTSDTNEDLFFNNNNNNKNELSSTQTPDQQPNQQQSTTLYCASVFERGLNWNRTEVESYVTQPCPAGSTGIAQWFCSPPTNNPNDLANNANEPHWMPAQPIFAQCQSTWLTQINKRMTNGESALLLSEELSNMIAETNQLYGGDIRGITELLRLLLQPLELMIAQHHQQEQTKIIKEMLSSIETICSTLLEDVYRQSWYELSPTNRKTAASLLLSALQRNSILYSDSITDNHHDYVKLHNNLYMAIHILPTNKLLQNELQGEKQNDLILPLNVIETGHVTSQPPIDNQFNMLLQSQFNGNSISIPTDNLLRYATNGQVRILFMMFKKLDTILEPELLRESDEYSVNKFGQNVTQMLNSDILSISLNGGNPPMINNPSLYGSLLPLTLTLRHLSTANVSNARCVHWNNELRNWSDQGCYLLESNQTHSKCSCKHHLTNFALLMDIQEGAISSNNYATANDKSTKLNELYPNLNSGLDEKGGDSQFLLNQWRHYSRPGATLLVFIVIGSIVSIIFLAITLTSLCCLVVKRNLLATVFEQCKLDNIPLVQKNLTFNLLAKQLVFLILICSSNYVTDKKCNIYYALFLIGFYYLLLSTFSWLFFTCYELYCVVCSKCMEFNTVLAAHAHAAGTLQSTNNLNSLHCSPANSATSSNGTSSNGSTTTAKTTTTTTTTMLSNGQLATTTTTTLSENSNSTLNTISQESQRRHRRLIYKLVPILLPFGLIAFVYWISKVQLIGNQINICSFESRVHFAALILITALFTLAVNLLFVLCTWRKIRFRSNSTNDLLQPNLMLITNGQNPASLPDFTLMNSMKSDPLELNGLPRFSPFTKKERLALFSSLTGTLLIIINSTLMILYLTHQFTFVGYLLTLTNTLIGLHLFLCCCLSRSRIRCKYGELLGKFKRRLICHRQSNKSNFLDSQLFNASTLISPAVQLHSRNATLKQQQANSNIHLNNPLISSGQLSSSKYFLNTANANGNLDLTDTGSDYGCKRLQQQMQVASTLNPTTFNHLQQQSNGLIVNNNNIPTHSSNQHLYHLYTAKQQGYNPYDCHGMVEHLYESIDDSPIQVQINQQQAVAQLAALRNSRTLGYRTNAQQQLQYQLQQQQFRSSNSSTASNNNSSIATNGSLIDRPLIPSSLSASTNYLNMNANQMNNKRLALLPAIVKDTNNGKTTIICGENELRDMMQQPDIQQQTFNHQFNKQNLVTVLNGGNKIITSNITSVNNDQGINI